MAQGIYIHIPFCAQKCAYCDFLSGPASLDEQTRYVNALCEELRLRLGGVWQKPKTIFIGGGTPSVLSKDNWKRLLATLWAYVDFSKLSEWTIEANPGTVDKVLLSLWHDAGVNRLSFGVQSFDEATLRLLGRIHTAEEAAQAIALAREAGFYNINLDLMYGLPGMQLETWQETVEQALALHPTHLSLYGLIVEEGTPIAEKIACGDLPEPDQDVAAVAYAWHTARLLEDGFQQYEISNFAQSGFASQHNQLYWRLEPWLGFGIGASGWTPPSLCSNTDDIGHYCTALEEGVLPPTICEHWTKYEHMSEYVIMGLRMNDGIALHDFQQQFGETINDVWPSAVAQCKSDGLLIEKNGRLFTSERGRLLGNIVAERFL